MDGYSLDTTQDRLESLKKLFPEAFSEGKVDFQRLRLALGDEVVSPEHYELTWAGKSEARREVKKRTTATLIPDLTESVDFHNSQNVYIEGENLEVLRVLQRSYFGKVKVIYIDPPYNTGTDRFVYPDDFSERKDEYELRTGKIDEEGFLNKLDLFKTNNGQLHSPWLSMMYPRLFLARNLLREDGVIFVSIDDNEARNLRLMMDEIFGEENFVAQIVWQKKYAVSNDDPGIAPMHDYIICYQKSYSFQRNLLPRTEKQLLRYKNIDNDPRGLWSSAEYVSSKSKDERPTLWYPIIHPKTKKEIWPDENAVWRYSREKHEKMVLENRLYWGPNNSYGKPRLKRFLSEIQDGLVPSTWWAFSEVGHNDEAQKETSELLGKKVFSTPKPIRLLRRILEISSKDQDIILDFFAGSSSLAQAVIEQNFEDNNNRRFIMIQLPESIDDNSEAHSSGYKDIAAIGRERIRRVFKKLEKEAQEAEQEVMELEIQIAYLQSQIEEQKTKQPELFNQSKADKATQKLLDKIEKMEEERAEWLDKAERLKKLPKNFRAFKLAKSNFAIWNEKVETKEGVQELMLQFTDPKIDKTESLSMLVEFLLKKGLPLTARIDQLKIDGTIAYSIEKGQMWVLLDGYNQAIRERILADTPKHVVCLDRLFEGNDETLTNLHLDLRDRGIDLTVL